MRNHANIQQFLLAVTFFGMGALFAFKVFPEYNKVADVSYFWLAPSTFSAVALLACSFFRVRSAVPMSLSALAMATLFGGVLGAQNRVEAAFSNTSFVEALAPESYVLLPFLAVGVLLLMSISAVLGSGRAFGGGNAQAG